MTDMIATRARSLAQDFLAPLGRRWDHVRGVAGRAESAATSLSDPRIVDITAASWLHDIGYAPSLAESGFHPLDGAQFARRSGMPELVVSLVAFHSGAEAEARERGMTAEFNEFTRPPQDVLDILTYADMTTSPTGNPVSAQDRLAEIMQRYDSGGPVFRAISSSASDLLAAVARVEQRLRDTEAAQPR